VACAIVAFALGQSSEKQMKIAPRCGQRLTQKWPPLAIGEKGLRGYNGSCRKKVPDTLCVLPSP